MPLGFGDRVALSLVVTELKVGGGVLKVDYGTTQEIVRRIKQVVVEVPNVEHNRRGSLEIGHIVEHLDRLEINWVQTVLDFAGLVCCTLWVPNGDVGICGAISIGGGDVTALEDKTADLFGAKTSGRWLLPGIVLFVVDGAI